MVSVSFTISDELRAKMEKFPWVNWSEVSREGYVEREKLHEGFEEFNKIVSKSKLTEEDAMKLAREVNAGMYKKLKKLHPELR